MKRIHLILLAAMATMVMSAIGGIGASSALAVKGPLWLVRNALTFDCRENLEGTKYESLLDCLAGVNPNPLGKWGEMDLPNYTGPLELDEAADILDLSLGNFVLFAQVSLITVEISCKHEDSEGSVEGGDPGKNHELLTFLECTVQNTSNCVVNSPGEPAGKIMVTAKSELVLRAREPRPHNLAVLFEPASGTTFVRLELSGGGCPIFTEGEQKVEGDIVGELEPEEGVVTEGMLTFPKEPIGKAFRWKSGTLEEISVSLKVFGTTAKQLGLADVHLTSGGLLGAHCGGCNV